MTPWTLLLPLLLTALPARAEEHGHDHMMTAPVVEEEPKEDKENREPGPGLIGAKLYLPPPSNNTGALQPKPVPVTTPPPGSHDHPGGDTQQPTGPIPGSFTEEGLEKEKQRLMKAYPESRLAIERTLSQDGLNGRIRREDMRKFEDYIRSRSLATAIIRKYWPDMPEDPSTENEAQMRAKFEGVVAAMQKTNPADLASFGKARESLTRDMDSVMQTGLAKAVHEGDNFIATRLHVDPDQHDEDWKNNRPNDPYPFNHSGSRQFQEGNYQKAVQDLSRAIELDPKDGRALTMRGAAFREMGDFEAAARDAAAALAINPNDKAAQNVYALSAGRKHLTAKDIASAPAQDGRGAASQAAFASAANPSSSLALLTAKAGVAAREAGKQFALGDYEKAARMAAEAAEKNPNDLLARFYQSAALGRMKDHDGALKAADAGLAIDPKSAALHLARAQALNRLGQYRDALAAASAAATINPRDPGALVASAEAYAGLGDRASALEALRKAAELDPRFAPLAEEAASLSSDADLLALLQGGTPAGSAGASSGLSGLMSRAGGLGTAAGAGILGVLLALAVGIALNLRRERDSNPR